MMEMVQIGLRGLQLLWTLLITALIGNAIASNVDGDLRAINFSMFVAVLSWLSVTYGFAAALVESLAKPIITMGLDGAATFFTLIDGIVLAATLTVVNCAADNSSKGDGWIGWGTLNNEKRCREIQASTTFMWFLFVTVAASLFLGFKAYRRTGGGSVRSSIGGPHMSQVSGLP
jgi:hypothetical protein